MKPTFHFLHYFITLLIFYFPMNTNGQNVIKTYDQQWKTAEEYTRKNLPKSALEEVKKIYHLAKTEKQEAQVIKAAVYMIELQAENSEAYETNAIRQLEQDIAASSEPAKAILKNLLASVYYSYYSSARWQLYARTATTNFKKEDIKTWTTEDFHQKIAELYLESTANPALLKKTKLAAFDAIITKGNARKLRPTLYDLLAHKALQYFSTDERNIKKPAYAFEIDQASAFDPAADFIHRKFVTKDSTSLEYQALLLYQKLIAFHINDPQPDALIDLDLQRIQYVKQKSVHPDTDELYLMAINHVADQYQKTPAAAQAWYLNAAFLNERGNLFNVGKDTSYLFQKIKAAEICQKVIAENPETEGGSNAYNLLTSIRQKYLQFTTESVNVPEKPFRVHLEYKNFDKLYLRLVKSTDEININLRRSELSETWKLLQNAAAVRKWEQALPDTKDYQQHSLELKVDALAPGEYILLAGTDKDFGSEQTVIGARLIYISNISYLQQKDNIFVLNRDSGQPLAGANVQIWDSGYDYTSRTYKKQKGPLLVTDKNGYLKKPARNTPDRRESELLEITHGSDRLFLQDPLQTYYIRNDENETPIESVFLFTDRSIYRPGQTVYYKGIVKNGERVLNDKARELQVVLYDVNNQEVAKIVRTTNDYGSFSGNFILPKGTLNGQFHIGVQTDEDDFQVTFHVEEYKRPKFVASFESVKETYKVNDTIKVTGAAIAYAGNTIDGAKVSYRVVRQSKLIYPWLAKRRWAPSTPLEIRHGETITDAVGKFTISFEAIPDRKTHKSIDPVFDYMIYADITDTNGETRSANTPVSAGYKSLLIKADIPEAISADSLKSLSIRTENMNGEAVASDVTVKIIRLTPENRLIRERFWQVPDLFVLTKNEFISHFPHDEYARENQPESWPEQGIVQEKTARTDSSKGFQLAEKLSAGFYKIEISTKDNAGEESKDIRYMEVTAPENDKLASPKYLWTEGSHTIEPGERTSIKVGTSATEVFLINGSQQKSRGANTLSFSTQDNQIRTFDLSATEADRGGYQVDYFFVKHNRVHRHTETIHVPWTNKDLNIEYQTFRDKTLPGSSEQWKVKITGYHKEQVAAEMLASMYDASLDQFYTHQWSVPDLWPDASDFNYWDTSQNFGAGVSEQRYATPKTYKHFAKQYDQLIGLWTSSNAVWLRISGISSVKKSKSRLQANEEPAASPMMIGEDQAMLEEVVAVGYGFQKAAPPKPGENAPESAIRRNFNETAFFFPDLKTDTEGAITFSFTMPEALTKWKFQALAHTKNLALGYSSKEIITQKDLMVQPNPPRFLREGDKMYFSSKIVNLAHHSVNGTVSLQLFDPETNQPVDDLFKNTTGNIAFDVPAGQSTAVRFFLDVPKGYTQTLTWRVTAKAGNISDAEENILPVLSNRMLVTESLPLHMRGNGSKDFKMEKLINSKRSTTLTNQSLTVEYTSNPAWYAVQALPYLMEYPYDCAEQTWNRYYANSLAASIVNRSPKIAAVFEKWQDSDTTALQSNLEKNQELKSLLLEETPWILAAKTESEQKKNIAVLFDLLKMSNELTTAIDKLIQLQSPSGGFVWFKGGPDDRYMTQYIVAGIGHLRKSGAVKAGHEGILNNIIAQAIPYLDQRIKEDYEELTKRKIDLKTYSPSPVAIHYLYMRSFYPEKTIPATYQKAFSFFMQRAKLHWTGQSKYLQGLTALALHRSGDKNIPAAILKSLKETAINNEELGMYWKDTRRGWWWHEAPIERQALLIEAFQEINGDSATVNDLKTWLLKNKQTNGWESTKATAEACYALLMKGADWLAENRSTVVTLGNDVVQPTPGQEEAGTGYFKKTFHAAEVNADMGNIRIETGDSKKASSLPTWGAVYWQYFEDLDQITLADTPLKLSKKLFIEKNTDRGPVLSPVEEGTRLHVGDRIKVRIELRADRDMEYLHMKDMRASALEPVNVLSQFKWQDGLGYYESTKDASVNFFFSNLKKGTYVFEYPLFVTHTGDFSNGITTIQCMYAPEFAAHSEGIRIKVEK